MFAIPGALGFSIIRKTCRRVRMRPLLPYLEHGMIHCLCMESHIRFSGDSCVDAPRLPSYLSRQSACAGEALGVGKGARWPFTLECHRVGTCADAPVFSHLGSFG